MARSPLLISYEDHIRRGQINDDSAQRRVIEKLETLTQALSEPNDTSRFSLRNLLIKKSKTRPESLYIWGNVGRGKSMLMDLFFDNLLLEKKRRVHFHAFMQDIHARIHALRQNAGRSKSGADPVVVLAREIAQELTLLCFDELQATDVADATLLHRLFAELFAQQVTIVSTSNHPPSTLYTGGIQKERFSKFIALIESEMQVVSLDSDTDYRETQGAASEATYIHPLGKAAEEAVHRIIGRKQPVQGSITAQGRKLPFKLYGDTTGCFHFSDLCEKPVGAADYLAIARRLKTIILTDIPKLAPEQRNEAKRFVTLIDALYEHKVKLIVTAAVPAEKIYEAGDGSFEFKRTVSRLREMQSEKWTKQ